MKLPDVPDHVTIEIISGSKLGIDTTKKLPGEGFKRARPEGEAQPREFRRLVPQSGAVARGDHCYGPVPAPYVERSILFLTAVDNLATDSLWIISDFAESFCQV